ncbi:MAG TPA: lanthionine synthetase LanC family protein [Streptosporangiaceae bacterium]|jgi:hypothetical protein
MTPAQEPMTERETVVLAGVLLADAMEEAKASDDFGLPLDVAMCLIDQQHAGGEPAGDPVRFLAQAAEVARGQKWVPPWLYGGVARMGWLAAQMVERGLLSTRNSGRIDDFVIAWAERYPEFLDVDLPAGILGLGVYGLAHPDRSIRETISRIVLGVISERTDSDEHGIFVRRVNTSRAQASPDYVIGDRDLGVAHGNMGVAAYLAFVRRSGLACADQALALLTPLSRWLLSMAIPGGENDPVYGVVAERYPQPAHIAWCYGDPGSSVALSLIAGALDDGALAERCRSTASRAAAASLARQADPAGIADCTLCHGAAGLTYFGRKWSAERGLDGLGHARRWAGYIQRKRRAGRLSYPGLGELAPNGSFLDGDCGVASALFYLVSDQPPLWEPLLLMAPPA